MIARVLYVAISVMLLLGWALAAHTSIPTGSRYRLPPSVRQSPGGYRSFHFWHSGSQLGK